jgi:ribonuclease R
VTRFGLFVTLDETGADGLVPIRSLPDDYYDHDEARHSLTGRFHGLVYRLGDPVEVRLVEADPVSGALALEILSGGSQEAPGRAGRVRRRSGPPKRLQRGRTGRRR